MPGLVAADLLHLGFNHQCWQNFDSWTGLLVQWREIGNIESAFLQRIGNLVERLRRGSEIR